MAASQHFCLLTRAVLAHHIGGGMEIHTQVIQRGLVRRGHRVTVITTPHPDGQTLVTDADGVTYFVGSGTPSTYAADWWQASLDMLLAVHQRDPIQVVGGQGKALYYYLRQRHSFAPAQQIPAIIITHNTIITDFQQQIRQFGRRPIGVLKWLPAGASLFWGDFRHMPQAEGITALSRMTAMAIQRWFPIDPTHVTVIPNGIDLHSYMPDTAQREATRQLYGLSVDEQCIVALGRLTPDKGHRYLLEALVHPAVRSAGHVYRLIIVGDGPAYADLEQQATMLGIRERVIFVGRVPHERVAHYLNAADIVALPSLFEGVPLSLLEAMACAKPVIATSVGAIADIVQNNVTAYIVPPGKIKPLAQALATLIDNPTLAQHIGQAARESVAAQYDVRQMADRYADFFETIATA